MNIGLNLAKPAESDLGLIMRLWMVNRGAWKLEPQCWEERVSDLVKNDPKLRSITIRNEVKGLDALRMLEAYLLCTKSTLIPSQMKQASWKKRHRNCPKCAIVGYHCTYFDYPWLEFCPVHEERLVTQCPDCSLPWPSAGNVFRRNCSTCGIRESIEFYLKHGAFDLKPFSERINPLQSLLNTPVRLVNAHRRYLFGQQTERNDQFSQVLSFPSVLARYKGIENKRWQPSRLELPIQECYQRQFELVQTEERADYFVEDSHVALMTRCRIRVMRIGTRLLEEQAGHKLGTCAKNTLHRHHDCVYCESWRQWTSGFECLIEQHPQQAMLTYRPPYTRLVIVPDPGLVTELYDHITRKRYQVPTRIQGLIYQIELWLCFRKLIAQIHYYLGKGANIKQSAASYSGVDRVFMSHNHHHFAYFYFLESENGFNLIFPKAYACTKLMDEEPQLSFFRELK